MHTPGSLLWDFHGTLGARSFSDSMLEALRDAQPDHSATKADLAAGIQGGFPWSDHGTPHELTDPTMWWRAVEALMQGGFERVGLSSHDAQVLAADAHVRYVDPALYEVYDDTRPALEALRDEGWRHWILSNHTPDLPAVITGLGLDDLFEEVFTSAAIGFEKPHAGIYEHARQRIGDTKTVWMIGDNIEADVLGAEACGIPAVLVRKSDDRATRRAADLHGVRGFLSFD